MGLHASEEVEREMLGGVYHPSFREIVESRLMLNDLTERLKPLSGRDYTVFTDRKNLSKLIGQKRGNLEKLGEMGYKIKVKEKSGAYLEIEES